MTKGRTVTLAPGRIRSLSGADQDKNTQRTGFFDRQREQLPKPPPLDFKDLGRCNSLPADDTTSDQVSRRDGRRTSIGQHWDKPAPASRIQPTKTASFKKPRRQETRHDDLQTFLDDTQTHLLMHSRSHSKSSAVENSVHALEGRPSSAPAAGSSVGRKLFEPADITGQMESCAISPPALGVTFAANVTFAAAATLQDSVPTGFKLTAHDSTSARSSSNPEPVISTNCSIGGSGSYADATVPEPEPLPEIRFAPPGKESRHARTWWDQQGGGMMMHTRGQTFRARAWGHDARAKAAPGSTENVPPPVGYWNIDGAGWSPVRSMGSDDGF
jgi:hypothetical protein